jgi:ribosomal protein L7Ae-like RNA K-turn-binding protein
MPYKQVKRGKKWCNASKGSGKVKKGRCHSTKEMARRQARAIMASEHGWKPTRRT